MQTLAEKRQARKQRKKDKFTALIMLMHMNDMDKITEMSNNTEKMSNNDMDEVGEEETNNNEETENADEAEPDAKRFRIDLSTITDPLSLDYYEMKERMSVEQFAAFKKIYNKARNTLEALPKFTLNDHGEVASLRTDIDSRLPIFLTDIQHLIMFAQMGSNCPYSLARWCKLSSQSKIRMTNVFIIENMSLYHYENNESKFTFLNEHYDNKVEILAPKLYEGDCIQELATVSLTSTQLRRYIAIHGNMDKAAEKCPEVFNFTKKVFPISGEKPSMLKPVYVDRFPRTDILLSGWQMVEENFPLPIKGLWEKKYKGYVLTKDIYAEVTPESPMFGLDCEMCRTTTGELELTRVSVVNESYETIYDELVKPDNLITDYLTRFSGITAQMMSKARKKLVDVQTDLRNLLPADAIIVGQSLNNDYHALKMMHPYNIDTSIIFNITGHRNRKTKLKTLSMEFLSESIQEGGLGHCSTEDSKASLKLAKLKLSKDIYFGDAVMSNIQSQIRQPSELGSASYATSLLKQVTKGKGRHAFIAGTHELAQKYCYFTDKRDGLLANKRITVRVGKTNEEVVQKLVQKKTSDLLIGHIKVTEEELAEESGATMAGTVDGWLRRLWECKEGITLNIVIFAGGQGMGNGACFIALKK